MDTKNTDLHSYMDLHTKIKEAATEWCESLNEVAGVDIVIVGTVVGCFAREFQIILSSQKEGPMDVKAFKAFQAGFDQGQLAAADDEFIGSIADGSYRP